MSNGDDQYHKLETHSDAIKGLKLVTNDQSQLNLMVCTTESDLWRC